MHVRELLEQASKALSANGITSPVAEARLLLAHALDVSLEKLLLKYLDEVPATIEEEFNILIERRRKHEPIAYITNIKEFYGRDFLLNHNVLIPRPDTEILIETVLAEANNFPQNQPIKILDLGTGSGCIAITLAAELKIAEIVAVDNSPEALEVARSNAATHKVQDQIQFIESNWFASIPKERFNFIVSNPPYISTSEQEEMSEETKMFEPEAALFAGNEGLEHYEHILQNAGDYLELDGIIFFEIGHRQSTSIQKIANQCGYENIDFTKDLQAISRVAVIKKPIL